MSNKIQRLTDFELIKGEYISITLSCKRNKVTPIDITNFTSTLKIYRYGDRTNEILSIQGQQVDNDKITFKITSANSDLLYSGKFEYIITVEYSNGDKNMGLGCITIV